MIVIVKHFANVSIFLLIYAVEVSRHVGSVLELPVSECFSFSLNTLLSDVAHMDTHLQEEVSLHPRLPFPFSPSLPTFFPLPPSLHTLHAPPCPPPVPTRFLHPNLFSPSSSSNSSIPYLFVLSRLLPS